MSYQQAPTSSTTCLCKLIKLHFVYFVGYKPSFQLAYDTSQLPKFSPGCDQITFTARVGPQKFWWYPQRPVSLVSMAQCVARCLQTCFRNADLLPHSFQGNWFRPWNVSEGRTRSTCQHTGGRCRCYWCLGFSFHRIETCTPLGQDPVTHVQEMQI